MSTYLREPLRSRKVCKIIIDEIWVQIFRPVHIFGRATGSWVEKGRTNIQIASVPSIAFILIAEGKIGVVGIWSRHQEGAVWMD